MPLRDRILRNEYHPEGQESLTVLSHAGQWMLDLRVDVARLTPDARVHFLRMIEAMDATAPLRLISGGAS